MTAQDKNRENARRASSAPSEVAAPESANQPTSGRCGMLEPIKFARDSNQFLRKDLTKKKEEKTSETKDIGLSGRITFPKDWGAATK